MARVGKQEFLVVGLGRFGISLALQLEQMGYSVLAIDQDRELVQRLADDISQTVALDATDEDALREVGADSFDTAVVAIGNDFENSVLITTVLKELGLRRVICKAIDERQKTILLRIGADQVILPEHEAGLRLAHDLVDPPHDQIDLPRGTSIRALRCPGPLAGHTLSELNLTSRFGVTVLLVQSDQLLPNPDPATRIAATDLLLVYGPDRGIQALTGWRP